MYFGASPVTFKKAKQLRARLTSSEKLLWNRVKNKQICYVRFRRQHPIETFIVDFYCHTVKMVIEIDGEIHLQQKEYDIQRDKEIAKYDIVILRFKNQEVENEIELVINTITNSVKQRLLDKFELYSISKSPLGDLGVKQL